MTDEEQRIAIAEACGYERTDTWISGWMRRTPEHATGFPCGLPDYPNDLNAMHEAEKVIVKFMVYEAELERVCKTRTVWNATARQRAEAFLKCLGKWKD